MTKPKTRITLQALDAVQIPTAPVLPDPESVAEDAPGLDAVAEPPADATPATPVSAEVRRAQELAEAPPGVSAEAAALLGLRLPEPEPPPVEAAPPVPAAPVAVAAATTAPPPKSAARLVAAALAAAALGAGAFAAIRPVPLDPTSFATRDVATTAPPDATTALAFMPLPEPVAAPPEPAATTGPRPATRPARVAPRRSNRSGDLF